MLLSNHSDQYMLGVVPFEFKNRNAAKDAAIQFKPNIVWEMMNPAFDAKCRVDNNGCPLKSLVLL